MSKEVQLRRVLSKVGKFRDGIDGHRQSGRPVMLKLIEEVLYREYRLPNALPLVTIFILLCMPSKAWCGQGAAIARTRLVPTTVEAGTGLHLLRAYG